jgi:hypothetical protein
MVVVAIKEQWRITAFAAFAALAAYRHVSSHPLPFDEP